MNKSKNSSKPKKKTKIKKLQKKSIESLEEPRYMSKSVRYSLYTFIGILVLISFGLAGTTLSNSNSGYLTYSNGVYSIIENETGKFCGNSTKIIQLNGCGADVCISRGNDALEDFCKQKNGDVVCKSTDNDCSDDINTAITNTQNGTKVLLRGNVFEIRNPINTKYGVILIGSNGMEGGGTPYTELNYSTKILWMGSLGGIMINASNSETAWGLEDLQIDGNDKAGYGIYKHITSGRARHLKLNRLTFMKINGTYFEMGNQVDDTSMYEVHFIEGTNGYNSIGIGNPNTEIRIYGGTFAKLKIGVYVENNSIGSSGMTFNGVIFGNNDNDVLINSTRTGTSAYTFPFRFVDSWFEPGAYNGRNRMNIFRVDSPTQLLSVSFTNCNFGIDQTNLTFINMSNAQRGSSLTLIGGRMYVPSGLVNSSTMGIYINDNVTYENYNFNTDPLTLPVYGKTEDDKISSQNLVGYWSFDNNMKDYSGNGYDGVDDKSPITYSLGKFGNSGVFNGSVRVTTTNIPLQNFTISAWVYTTNNSADKYIVSKDPNAGYLSGTYSLYTYSNYFRLVLQNGSSTANQTFFTSKNYNNINVWNHVAVTYDGSKVTIYVNGQYDNSYPYSGIINTYTANTTIGSGSGSAGFNYFYGNIDDVMIFNISLSYSAIKSLYESRNELTPQDSYHLKSDLVIKECPSGYFLSKIGKSTSCVAITNTTQGLIFGISKDNILAYWNFNNNYNDSSGSRHLTESNPGLSLRNGVFGDSYYFNGTARIKTTIPLNITNNITIMAWINSTNLTADKYIVARSDLASYSNDAYTFYTSSSFIRVAFQTGTTSAEQNIFQSTTSITTNTTYHVAVVQSGNNISIYINGLNAGCSRVTGLYSCTNFTGVLNSPSTGIGIGGSSGATLYNPFYGTIDEVIIINKSLSSDEIYSYYNSLKPSNISSGNEQRKGEDYKPIFNIINSLGSSTLRWLKLWVKDIDVSGNVTMSNNDTMCMTIDCSYYLKYNGTCIRAYGTNQIGGCL